MASENVAFIIKLVLISKKQFHILLKFSLSSTLMLYTRNWVLQYWYKSRLSHARVTQKNSEISSTKGKECLIYTNLIVNSNGLQFKNKNIMLLFNNQNN